MAANNAVLVLRQQLKSLKDLPENEHIEHDCVNKLTGASKLMGFCGARVVVWYRGGKRWIAGGA